MTDPRDAAKDLETPAGIDAPDDPGTITHMTARRKEMLDRMKENLKDLGPVPPAQASQPDDRNTEAYREEWITQRAVADDEEPGEEPAP